MTWEVLGVARSGPSRSRDYLSCRCCDCGAVHAVRRDAVEHGLSTCCVKCRGKFHRTHGRTGTPEWRSWNSMLRRCTTPGWSGYVKYGARGITVCERWRASFEAFLADMGPRPAGTTLDRINNAGNYEPGNCRWATLKTQARNTRSNRRITANGETLTLTEWAERSGVLRETIAHRLKRGMSPSEALRNCNYKTGREF